MISLAVFFSSHDLEMVQRVADKIVRVDKGNIWLQEKKDESSEMNTLFEILNPSYLLFPALLGTVIMGLVCPLVGSYLVLRRTIFLGLTLPQIAAAGVSFTFWLQQSWLYCPSWGRVNAGIAMVGSLVFTFLGMGWLGYLEQRGKGLARRPAGRCLCFCRSD